MDSAGQDHFGTSGSTAVPSRSSRAGGASATHSDTSGHFRMRSELFKGRGDQRRCVGRHGQSKVTERRELHDRGRPCPLCTEPRSNMTRHQQPGVSRLRRSPDRRGRGSTRLPVRAPSSMVPVGVSVVALSDHPVGFRCALRDARRMDRLTSPPPPRR
ncbi:hypothetical protein SMALB_4316 [Streptomyces malaysiensis]|uniref:Uncharacterized protein n=1 Tax=Streptomyces malaysiensis TaxID=92644 RepID=A0A7X5X6I7_STRMQ|nr:hypothetical protein [Streptomyces malaysiensis]